MILSKFLAAALCVLMPAGLATAAAGGLPVAAPAEVYVSPAGDDSNPGTIDRPLATIARARDRVRGLAKDRPITVYLRGGTYELKQTLVFSPADSGNADAPIVYAAYPGETPNLSGGRTLDPDWRPYRDGVFEATVPKGMTFDQLFVNGERQIRARFPDYDPDNPLRDGKGYLHVVDGSNRRPDTWFAFDPKTFTKKRWTDPDTGIVHAFQSVNWGNMQYRVRSVDRTRNRVMLGEGGWQLQRRQGIGKGRGHASPFFVENVFEELDAPGEWFLDEKTGTLYFMPPEGLDLKTARCEAVVLKDLVRLKGAPGKSVRHVTLRGLTFSRARLTFMEKYEPVSRSDWAIHRGGAVYAEGAEDCRIEDCDFDTVGGNAVFFSGYNRRNEVTGCRFVHTGESPVAFVGLPKSVRVYQTWDQAELHGRPWLGKSSEIPREPGPASEDYPADCAVSNCVMHDIGDFGKQVAAVFIAMSRRITVSRCTIYNTPRAGICIGDGCWGGHVIEHCDIWETVRETGEHGPFNSWGRERMWFSGRGDMIKELVKLDALEPTIIRHNRIANFRKSISAGNWTIDLDDGSSVYEIYNNLSLGSTLKLRDGFYRKVYNNIHVSPVPMGWHVWPAESEDEFFGNITVVTGARPGQPAPEASLCRPVRAPPHPWGKRIDRNLYWNVNTRKFLFGKCDWAQWRELGYDRNSVFADPMFVDPLRGDYRVRPDSPALKLGFRNFPMDEFGHRMTRIEPFGGEFEKRIAVTIRPDARGGAARYTLDGSEPNAQSPPYRGPLNLTETTTIKARTFKNGLPVGFVESATFSRVDKVERPTWLSSLLAGRWVGGVGIGERKPAAGIEKWMGATIRNVRGDADLVDATGGQDFGVFLESVPVDSPLARCGFKTSDIIIEWNGRKVADIRALKRLSRGKTDTGTRVRVRRGYETVELTIPATAD